MGILHPTGEEVDPKAQPEMKKARRKRAGLKSKRGNLLCYLFRLVFDVAFLHAGYHRAKLLRWLEDRDGPRGDLDRRTSAWVTRHPCLAMSNLEGAETAHFDVFLILQRFFDGLEKGIDDARAVL